ncbi:MAG: DUF421 domain-containing protein [Clostridia bacterium]
MAIISLAILFLLCKLMGNKQISQLSMFDYIIGISIGSIAAEMATELENPLYPALAMVLYALTAFCISIATSKWVALRKFMTGKPILLLDNGVIYRENMKRARFDLSDFLTLCRINGYFDLSDLQTAILEENGTVSFLPKACARPLIPRDISQFPQQHYVCVNVILDGILLPRTLASTGHCESWLIEQLHSLGYQSYQSIFLATITKDDRISVFPMTKESPLYSPFD